MLRGSSAPAEATLFASRRRTIFLPVKSRPLASGSMALFSFFISSNLFRLGVARADNANDIRALGVTDDEHPVLGRHPHRQEPPLVDRVLVILNDDRERVSEDGRCFEERNASMVDD